ncbi:hypothetical protein MDA_GLEAN10015527 [Myotis davidii]|uniref:Uncharacterized protein n=1 Tax=Myotis davidii TaxID=225400 RepID=L5MAQ9_MYODS|nr:hypothetical protein MDA_GLEAN10015527 [Myotis davidii]
MALMQGKVTGPLLVMWLLLTSPPHTLTLTPQHSAHLLEDALLVLRWAQDPGAVHHVHGAIGTGCVFSPAATSKRSNCTCRFSEGGRSYKGKD